MLLLCSFYVETKKIDDENAETGMQKMGLRVSLVTLGNSKLLHYYLEKNWAILATEFCWRPRTHAKQGGQLSSSKRTRPFRLLGVSTLLIIVFNSP